MITEAIVVMTMYGCGDQAKSCDFLAENEKTWKSYAACKAEIPAVLSRQMEAPYPIVTAICDYKQVGVTSLQIDITNQANTEAAISRSASGYFQTTTMFDQIRASSNAPKKSWLGSVKASISQTLVTARDSLARGFGQLK